MIPWTIWNIDNWRQVLESDVKTQTLLNEELRSQEQIVWAGRPARKLSIDSVFLLAAVLVVTLYLVLEMTGIISPQNPINGPLSPFWLLIIPVLIMFVFLLDRNSDLKTIYVITGQRVLVAGPSEDGHIRVGALTLSPKTMVWQDKKWGAIHIRTPFEGTGFFASWGNRLKLGGMTFNNVENQEHVVSLIQNIIYNKSQATS